MTSLNVSTHERSRLLPLTTCATILALTAGAFAACGPSNEGGSQIYGDEGGNGGVAGSGGVGGGVGGVGGGVGGVGGGVGGVGGGIRLDSGTQTGGAGGSGNNCGAVSVEVKRVTKEETITEEIHEKAPAAVFIMFDQSQSMTAMEGNVSRWQAVTEATSAFIRAPESAGLSVGIQYFGRAAGVEECNTAVYAQAEVPIAVLPGNANALVNSINSHRPVSETPTTAALTGAIQHARQFKTQNPMMPVFVLLVTDGEPGVAGSFWNPISNCVGTAQDVPATVAAAQAGQPNQPDGIKTFVLGVGAALANLNQIAAAGGTTQAHLISGGNVSQQVITALNTIRGTVSKTVTKTITKTVPVPLDCEWVMPPPMGDKEQDPNKVNVNFVSGGALTQLGKVGSQADCANFQNGWYYDDPAAPTKIIACPSTCDSIKASTDGKIDILVGCDTYVAPPK